MNNNIFKNLLIIAENNELLREKYINRKGDKCIIGHLLSLCGIDNKALNSLNQAHILHPKKIIGISDIMEESTNLDICKKEFQELIIKIRSVLSAYQFNIEELEELQFYNDKRSKEELVDFIRVQLVPRG